MPKEVNYEEKIVALKNAISALKDDDASMEDKNRLLKAIVKRIELKTEDTGFSSVGISLKINLKL